MEHNPTQTLQIEVVRQSKPDVKIIKLSGPLTIHNFFEFQSIAREKPLPRVMIVDLTDVPYIDSAALGSFVGIHVSCEAAGRQYALVGANERLKNLFDVTRTGTFLVLKDTMVDAQALGA